MFSTNCRHTKAWMWKKNIRIIPWPDLYSLKKLTSAYCNQKVSVSKRRHVNTVFATYDRGSEWTIQPTTTLTNKLSSLFGDISFSLTGLDICQGPLISGLGDQFETENTIFGQEHVLCEDVHSINTLWTQTIRQRVITMEILLQRAAENSAIPVSGEGTRQDGDISETTF